MKQTSLLTPLASPQDPQAAVEIWCDEYRLSSRQRCTITVETHRTDAGQPGVWVDLAGLKLNGLDPIWAGGSRPLRAEETPAAAAVDMLESILRWARGQQ